VDQVIAARPAAVLIAGDLFHSVRPTNTSIVLAFNELYRLRRALGESAPIVVIAGNHDTPRSTDTGWILSLFESLGVEVVTQEARRLAFPALDLSIFAVPHPALVSSHRPALRREGPERNQVLLIHCEVVDQLPSDRGIVEYGGAQVTREELVQGDWTYAALGHYHVQHAIAPRVWYSGALEYVNPNPWGQLEVERERGVRGKGWLLVDLDSGEVEPQPVAAARRVIDLPWLDGAGHTAAELDTLIARAVAAIPGGHRDQIVRQVIRNVPRHVGRELNHAALRGYMTEALHFQLDLRRPETQRQAGSGAAGRRQTLPELVETFLRQRPLPADVDRDEFLRTGTELMAAVEREWAQG